MGFTTLARWWRATGRGLYFDCAVEMWKRNQCEWMLDGLTGGKRLTFVYTTLNGCWMVCGDGDSTMIKLLKLGEDLYTSEFMPEGCRSYCPLLISDGCSGSKVHLSDCMWVQLSGRTTFFRVRNFEWVVQGYGVRKRFCGIGDVWVVSGGQVHEPLQMGGERNGGWVRNSE
ncbi:hypothetical protein T07_3224 [Trichinella nelsoni]|uniref:Uncharacterized protein n=1 Tax=Trichinella nelsoni TaxID=6336 RepID=A0A0V0RQB4_9BILA|nr:hypothetical protein T07_3224 [Trichinella nelsoni]